MFEKTLRNSTIPSVMVIDDVCIHEKAFDKMYSNIITLQLKIKFVEKEIKSGGSGGIDMEQLIGIKEHTESELDIWNYMLTVIEKSKV